MKSSESFMTSLHEALSACTHHCVLSFIMEETQVHDGRVGVLDWQVRGGVKMQG